MITFAVIAGFWFGVTGCFVLVMAAKRLRAAGRLNLFWTINVLPWAVLGLMLDCLFNLTAGTMLFIELPRELLFSHRVQRHWNGPKGSQRARMAAFWARQLNQIDEGHIK